MGSRVPCFVSICPLNILARSFSEKTADPRSTLGRKLAEAKPSDVTVARFAVFLRKSGDPSRTRTCDPLVKRAFKPITTSHGSYDLLTFFTGCSRFGVHLVATIHTCLPVFTSQICHKQ